MAANGTANGDAPPKLEGNVSRASFASTESATVHWDVLDMSDIANRLNSDVDKGMKSSDAEQRLQAEGLNELEKPSPPTLLMLFVMQMTNIIMVLLTISAFASLAIAAVGDERDEWLSYVEGTAIMGIVILNAMIAAVTENAANSALAALASLSQAEATVIRDGQEIQVPSTHVVRGDVILIQTGDIVPADVRVYESAELKVNEMLLTGEPDDVAKT